MELKEERTGDNPETQKGKGTKKCRDDPRRDAKVKYIHLVDGAVICLNDLLVPSTCPTRFCRRKRDSESKQTKTKKITW